MSGLKVYCFGAVESKHLSMQWGGWGGDGQAMGRPGGAGGLPLYSVDMEVAWGGWDGQESTEASASASASAKLGHFFGLGLGLIGPKLAEFQIKICAIIFHIIWKILS